MRLYADQPARRARQIVVDAAVALWVIGWVQVARAVHEAVAAVATVGYRLQDGAGGIADNLTRAGSGAAQVPLVGGPLGDPLTGAGRAASSVADAGQRLGEGIDTLAVLLAVLVAAFPIVSVLGVWLAVRIRFARRAEASAELAGSQAGLRLLALRALTRRPLPRLMRIDPDPVAAWRRDDPQAVTALAALELSRVGVRPATADVEG